MSRVIPKINQTELESYKKQFFNPDPEKNYQYYLQEWNSMTQDHLYFKNIPIAMYECVFFKPSQITKTQDQDPMRGIIARIFSHYHALFRKELPLDIPTSRIKRFFIPRLSNNKDQKNILDHDWIVLATNQPAILGYAGEISQYYGKNNPQYLPLCKYTCAMSYRFFEEL